MRTIAHLLATISGLALVAAGCFSSFVAAPPTGTDGGQDAPPDGTPDAPSDDSNDGLVRECPAARPPSGSPCMPEGLLCAYDQRPADGCLVRCTCSAGVFACVDTECPFSCGGTSPTTTPQIVPRVALTDQPIEITTYFTEGGCGCSPSASATLSPGAISIDTQACGCCTVCDCAYFPTGVATVGVGSLAAGDYAVTQTGGTATTPLYVRDRATCADYSSQAPTTVDVMDPGGVGDPVRWIHARIPYWVSCCTPGLLGLVAQPASADLILSAVDCDPPLACDCVSWMEDVDVWYPILEVDYSGRTSVVVNGTRVPLP